MHRIVHLDLKGAPLKLDYMEKVLRHAKLWGTTGILMEWEDTFPYTGDLECIGSENIEDKGDTMYSLKEVNRIIHILKENNLELIQLVQTMGHMEFVLKHERFSGLRENAQMSTSLCPSQPESQSLVRAMITQLLVVQPDAKYFHIGGDEVWYLSRCSYCKSRGLSNESIYLEHMSFVASYVKSLLPHVTVLMWDDMIRNLPEEFIRMYRFGDLVVPVYWDYSPIDMFNIQDDQWIKYDQVFSRTWVASAFKGANGMTQMLCGAERYVSNQEAWKNEMKKRVNANLQQFAGIILTGWSRYHHGSPLCELMPASMYSLQRCLRLLTEDDAPPDDRIDKSHAHEWSFDELEPLLRELSLIGEKVIILANDITLLLSMSVYERTFDIERTLGDAKYYMTVLQRLKTDISERLSQMTGPKSCKEWVDTYIVPLEKQFPRIFEMIELYRKTHGLSPSTDPASSPSTDPGSSSETSIVK